MSQKDLFPDQPRWPKKGEYPEDLYGGRPPSVPVDTSEAAMTREEATRKAGIILGIIRATRDYGMTCDEAEVSTGWTHQTCSARFRELELKDHIRKTERKRMTRHGRRARVYVWEAE